jgi:hypothetical protein
MSLSTEQVALALGLDKKAGRRRPLPPGVKPLLSPGDLAEIYGVSLRSIWRLLAAGKIPAPDLRIGKLPRWRQESIVQ